jgi:hypothetical protein
VSNMYDPQFQNPSPNITPFSTPATNAPYPYQPPAYYDQIYVLQLQQQVLQLQGEVIKLQRELQEIRNFKEWIVGKEEEKK